MTHLERLTNGQTAIFNLGSGEGHSVLQMVQAFSAAVGREIPLVMEPRREGDVGTLVADPQMAQEALGWRTEKTLREMCMDLWRYQAGSQGQGKNECEDNHGEARRSMTLPSRT